MNSFEKLFSVCALIYIVGLAAVLLFYPGSRSPSALLPLSLVGVAGNAGLLFIVFKDIFSRTFDTAGRRYFWAILIFFFMPAILVYLPRHGFKPR